MRTLKEILLAPPTRPNVVSDSVRVIDDEVASKGGLGGIAIKTIYGMVKALKPGAVAELCDHMLDDFAGKLDPIYQAAKTKSEPVAPYFNARPGEVADALLSITDERARRAKNQMLKGAYEKLRPSGKKHVEAAVPRIGRLVQKYSDAAAAPPPAAPPAGVGRP